MAIMNNTSTNKTILITGSTDGVGRSVAERLACPGNTLLIHGRHQERGESLVSRIEALGAKAVFYAADFASLKEVRRLAEDIQRDYPQLDVLVNNAGIGVSGRYPNRTESGDGIERRFAINYLAGFLLTRLLLPQLRAGHSARVVNVASAGQQAIDFSDVMLQQGYSGRRAYCQSKLAQILFTFDLAEELRTNGIQVNALHPATYMDTAMVRDDGISPTSRVDEGADAILNLITASESSIGTGQYFDGLRPTRAHPQAYDMKAREQLRALSYTLTYLTKPQYE